jgi:hypothetical protein
MSNNNNDTEMNITPSGNLQNQFNELVIQSNDMNDNMSQQNQSIGYSGGATSNSRPDTTALPGTLTSSNIPTTPAVTFGFNGGFSGAMGGQRPPTTNIAAFGGILGGQMAAQRPPTTNVATFNGGFGNNTPTPTSTGGCCAIPPSHRNLCGGISTQPSLGLFGSNTQTYYTYNPQTGYTPVKIPTVNTNIDEVYTELSKLRSIINEQTKTIDKLFEIIAKIKQN